MFEKKENGTGFTIIELFVIVLIIGILAAVAFPIYRANVNQIKASEAETILNTILTSLRLYYVDNSSYPTSPSFRNILDIEGLDLTREELSGQYYNAKDFYYKSTNGIDFILKADDRDHKLPIKFMNSSGEISDSTFIEK